MLLNRINCTLFGNFYVFLIVVRIVAVKTLKQYGAKEPKVLQPLLSWFDEVQKAAWNNPNELKQQFGNASVLSGKRVIFNIHGNKYRLIVDIEYQLQLVFILWIGSHAEYDKVDAQTIIYVKAN
jgi:mRNA interferase HigB